MRLTVDVANGNNDFVFDLRLNKTLGIYSCYNVFCIVMHATI